MAKTSTTKAKSTSKTAPKKRRTKAEIEAEKKAKAERKAELARKKAVELWASYLGTTRMTILRYEKNRGEEWQSFIEQVKGLITAAKKQLIYRQKIPAIVGIFDLCNNSGYSNTSEFKLSAQQFEPEKKALSSKELPKLFAEAEEISKTENIDKSQAVVRLLAENKRYE